VVIIIVEEIGRVMRRGLTVDVRLFLTDLSAATKLMLQAAQTP